MRYRILVLCFTLLLTASCLAGTPDRTQNAEVARPESIDTVPTPQYWPSDGWRTATAEEHGIDGEKLAQMLEYIEKQNINLHSLLVIRDGYLVSETYFDGYDQDSEHELYSCTKSFVATLIGIAIDQGAISNVEQPVLDFFPQSQFENLDEDKANMTLENLLTMTAGLDWREGNLAYGQLYRSSDWDEYMLDLKMSEPPGERFNYCSGCSHVLSAIIQTQVGKPTQDFADSVLFEPLGIDAYQWSLDAEGNAIGGWGLQLTPRQMAKLGFLYLHGGIWDGYPIVSKTWVEQATSAHVSTGEQGFGYGYGYQWWIAPKYNAYAALGLAGQTIYVAPALNLIVVTTADMDGHGQIFRLIDEYILPAVN